MNFNDFVCDDLTDLNQDLQNSWILIELKEIKLNLQTSDQELKYAVAVVSRKNPKLKTPSYRCSRTKKKIK